MTNQIDNVPRAKTENGTPRSLFRSAWILSVLVLWILVIAATITLVRQRERARSGVGNAMDLALRDSTAAAVATEAQGGEGEKGEAKGTEAKPPASPWNPNGIDDFVFTERSGRKVTKADLLGHPWLVSFIFTRCAGPCPRVSTQMSALQRLLKGSDVRLVTLTVDPDFDTADVLNRYADAYRADPKRWLYLTGDKRKTYELINKSFLMPVKEMTGKDREPGYEVLHSTNILLVNEKGVVVKKYNATNDVEMAALRRDLKPYLEKTPAENAKSATSADKARSQTSAHGGRP